jgi:hypothetical protein
MEIIKLETQQFTSWHSSKVAATLLILLLIKPGYGFSLT